MHFVPFPDPSNSGNQMLGECTVLGGPCILYTSPVQAAQFICCTSMPGVLCVSSGELVSGCDIPGQCELSKIQGRCGYRLTACSQFCGKCSLGAKIEAAPCIPALTVTPLPLCLQGRRVINGRSLVSFGFH